MKKCNVCNAVQEKDGLFCEKCGSQDLTTVEDVVDIKAEVITDQPKSSPLNQKLVILLGSAVAVLLVAVLVLVLMLNPTGRIMRSVKSGDYMGAGEIYQEKVEYGSKAYQKLYEELSSFVYEKLDQYRNEEITYDALVAELNGVDMVGALGYDITYAYDEAYQLNFCRETYAAAEKALEDKDYANAMTLYGQVCGLNFENSESAVLKYSQSLDLYRNEIVNQVNNYLTNNEFEQAKLLLDQALVLLPEDAQFTQLLQNCQDGEYQYGVQQMIAEAQVYADGKDFIAALTCLENHISENPEEVQLRDAMSQQLKDFEAYVLEESLRLAREDKFQHAASLAESGLGYFDSAEVVRLLNIYKSHLPVLLGEMEMFKNDTKGGSMASKTDEVDAFGEDNYGNKYEHSFHADCGSVVYLVNFKYKTFSGTVAFPKGVESDSYRTSATLRILGDGKEIAKFADFNSDSKPQYFELDITSYEKITLEWDSEGSNVWSNWGYFATVFDGVLEPIPVELPAE